MSKHTPGPWSYRGSLGPQSNPHLKGPHVVESASGTQIAIMNGWRSDVSEANARLIAAAPEMYEALRRLSLVAHEASGYVDNPAFSPSMHRELIRSVSDAITVLAKIDKGGNDGTV